MLGLLINKEISGINCLGNLSRESLIMETEKNGRTFRRNVNFYLKRVRKARRKVLTRKLTETRTKKKELFIQQV